MLSFIFSISMFLSSLATNSIMFSEKFVASENEGQKCIVSKEFANCYGLPKNGTVTIYFVIENKNGIRAMRYANSNEIKAFSEEQQFAQTEQIGFEQKITIYTVY